MNLGIIAAAGQASRLNGIPKFLLPLIGDDKYLLNRTINILKECGVDKINIGLSEYTNKIAEPFIDGLNVSKCSTKTMNETIQILNKDHGNISICIMPDTYFDNPSGVPKSVELLKNNDSIASICIWKLRKSQRGSVGQVEIDGDRVVYIDAKDPHIGYAVQKATENGEKISYVLNDGYYFDCGTVEQYWKLINYLTLGKEAN